MAGVYGNEAISIYYELSALMKTIKLPMAKWATSCEELKGIWKAEGQEIQKTTQAWAWIGTLNQILFRWTPGTSWTKQRARN